jgi:hypothetical protein
MNYLKSLHLATTRLIEIEKIYYTTFPDQPDLEPGQIDKYAMLIGKLYPEEKRAFNFQIIHDSAGAHVLFKIAPDHMACISTVENSVGLYDCYRHNDDLEACLEHDPIYMGHFGEDWN